MERLVHPALIVGVGTLALGAVVMWLAWRRPDVIDRLPIKPWWWSDGATWSRLYLALCGVAAIVVGLLMTIAALTGYG